jgi:hypothetical protein
LKSPISTSAQHAAVDRPKGHVPRVCSVVVAGVSDLHDQSNVLLSPRKALRLLGHVLALIQRRGKKVRIQACAAGDALNWFAAAGDCALSAATACG